MKKFSIFAFLAASILTCPAFNLNAASKTDANSAEVRAEMAKFDKTELNIFNSWGKFHDGMSFDEIETIVGPCFSDFRVAKDKIMARVDGTNYAVTMNFEYVVKDISAKDVGENGFRESRFVYQMGNYTMVFDCNGKMVSHRRAAADDSYVFMTGE